MRRDALANQERVLAAAVTTMLREGRQVPMADIAAEAGVGVGTVYRKYPNREALLLALTERAFGLLAEIAARAAAGGGTGREQLSRWWDEIISDHDQLVLPLHGGPTELSPGAVAEQRRLHSTLRGILRTGGDDGTVRSDVTLGDIILFGAMLVSPMPGQRDWPRVAMRQKRIYLDGLAAR